MFLERLFKRKKENEKKECELDIFSPNSLLLPSDESFVKEDKGYESVEIVSEKAKKRANIMINKKDALFLIVEIILIAYFILGVLGIVPLF